MSAEAVSRRSAVTGGVVVVVAGAAGYGVAHGSAAARPKRVTTGANTGGAGGGGGVRLADASAVPAGGGLILGSDGVVLSRDPAGTVRGFSAICTHQGCTVNAISGNTIDCPCHGSRFDLFTGAPVAGPATAPLPPIPVTVRDGAIFSR